jgi:hypothetical protein
VERWALPKIWKIGRPMHLGNNKKYNNLNKIITSFTFFQMSMHEMQWIIASLFNVYTDITELGMDLSSIPSPLPPPKPKQNKTKSKNKILNSK